ncbi:MAG TPA: hypothetical protein VF765_13715 [Polyangiaceae bacterium]
MQEPYDLRDDEPISEIRTIESRTRRLIIDTGLRGTAAESAWVTVSDEQGAVRFEGTPGADGCIEVAFESGPAVTRAHVLLETPRLHRQAVIDLHDGWNAHAFKA